MINDLVKKLRKAADVLEELLDFNPFSNQSIKKKIEKNIDRIQNKKLHWTQKPENKERLTKMLRASHAKRKKE